MSERVREVLGRLFGNRGWDPAEYRNWTRYLVVRPLVLSLPTAFGIVLGIFLTLSDKGWVAFLVPFVGGVLGVTLGGWYWLRQETKRTREA
jgi:hypothetical protein